MGKLPINLDLIGLEVDSRTDRWGLENHRGMQMAAGAREGTQLWERLFDEKPAYAVLVGAEAARLVRTAEFLGLLEADFWKDGRWGSLVLKVKKPIPVPCTVSAPATTTTTLKVANVWDKGLEADGKPKPAFIDLAFQVFVAGKLCHEGVLRIGYRARGGFGGEEPPLERVKLPDRKPDNEVEFCPTWRDMVMWALAAQDPNLRHLIQTPEADPSQLFGPMMAQFVVNEAVEYLAEGDPEQVLGLNLPGILAPVRVGETMTLRQWREGNKIFSQLLVLEKHRLPGVDPQFKGDKNVIPGMTIDLAA